MLSLTSQNWNGWNVFGIALLLGALLLLVSAPLAFILQRQVEGELWNILAGSLVSSLITPFEALVLGVLYFRLLDIETAQPPPSLSGAPVYGD